MFVYIKDKKTFDTKSLSVVLDYELNPSIYDTVSTVVIPKPDILPNEGDIIFLEDGFIGVIASYNVEYEKVTLDINQISMLFSRNIFYTQQTFEYAEDYLASLIQTNFINQTDSFYALPYLTVSAETHTTSSMKPDLENNLFSVKSYASKLRRLLGIFLNWSLTKDTLTVTIAQKNDTAKNIDFSNPDYILTEQTFSSKTVSKITSFAEDTSAYQDWYLLSDGTITNTATQDNRVDGEWVSLVVSESANVEDTVKSEFYKNEYSHKIKFTTYTSNNFELYDRLLISLNGSIFSSYVSGLVLKKNSNIVEVECGELQTQYPFLNLD